MATRYKGSKKTAIALDTWIKFLRARETVWRRVNPSMSTAGVTPTQFAVLEALLHLGPLSQKELSKKLLVSAGNIVTVIDNLERNNIVARESNPNDRRIYMITLTKKGRALINRLFPIHVKAIVENLSTFDESEQIELSRLCKKLGIG